MFGIVKNIRLISYRVSVCVKHGISVTRCVFNRFCYSNRTGGCADSEFGRFGNFNLCNVVRCRSFFAVCVIFCSIGSVSSDSLAVGNYGFIVCVVFGEFRAVNRDEKFVSALSLGGDNGCDARVLVDFDSGSVQLFKHYVRNGSCVRRDKIEVVSAQ